MRPLKWIGGLLLLVIVLRACGGAGDESVAGSPTDTPPSIPSPPPQPDKAMLAIWAAGLSDESIPATLREGNAKSIIASFPNTPEAAKAQELLPKLTERVADERDNGAWSYSSEEDGMSGKRVGRARVESDNTLSLGFPYEGAQRGGLQVRRHPRWGNDVIVTIEEGQILCSSYDCPIRVRFDDGRPMTYTGNAPADNSSDTVFLPYSIANKLKSAKRVRVEMNIYQNGVQLLEFNVKGFNPERMTPKQ